MNYFDFHKKGLFSLKKQNNDIDKKLMWFSIGLLVGIFLMIMRQM